MTEVTLLNMTIAPLAMVGEIVAAEAATKAAIRAYSMKSCPLQSRRNLISAVRNILIPRTLN
jgi:hypothetical protein